MLHKKSGKTENDDEKTLDEPGRVSDLDLIGQFAVRLAELVAFGLKPVTLNLGSMSESRFKS
jgi:hypothetical protein